MKTETLTISVCSEKLRAIKLYMGKRGANLDDELTELMGKLYTKFVPQSVREFIDDSDEMNAPPARSNSKSQG